MCTDAPQELNPGPFAAMILNHTGWLVYSVLHLDWFIFVMEAFGLLCGIWLTFSLYPLASLTASVELETWLWRCQRWTLSP